MGLDRSSLICGVLFITLSSLLYASNAQRFSQLKQQSQKNTIVSMNGNTFQEHASSKHNFSMIVLFSTTNKQVQCQYCSSVDANFKAVAEYYRDYIGANSPGLGKGYDSDFYNQHPVIFAYVDVTSAKEFIQAAQWNEIPKLFHIPPRQTKGEGVLSLEELQNLLDDYSTERIGQYVADKTNNGDFKIPVSLSNILLMGVGAVILVYVVATRVVPNLMVQYKKPRFWLILSLGAYAFAMAGTVFNSINKPPWWYKHPNGQIFYVYPQQRQQFIGEGLGMAGLLTLAAVLFTVFGAVVPTLKGVNMKRVVYVMALASFWFVYDLIFKIFKVKVNWYPF